MISRSGSPLVSIENIRRAGARLRDVVPRTPLVDVSTALPPASPGIRLKCENLQPIGAFKLRGAFNMLAQLAPEERRRGVITYSSGNHALALAYSARLMGAPAVVVMPTNASAVKLEGARTLGAEVILEGTTSKDRQRRAESEAASRGLTMVPPFDHPWIVEGQGTIGVEILEQEPDVDAIYVPVGGGGLIAGVAAAVKALKPSVRIVGVEPVGAAKMTRSLEAGQPVTLDHVQSLADGLLPVSPAQLTFDHVRDLVDEMITVEDDQIAAAVRWIFRESRLVAEPSGAVGVAAILDRLTNGHLVGGPIVAIVSGGNVAPDVFARILSGL